MATRSRIVFNIIRRNVSQQSGPSKPEAGAAAAIKSVSGLSESVVYTAKEPVGPNVDPAKSGNYKVPEYFCYNTMSYYEAEIEMSKFRQPQPSNKSK